MTAERLARVIYAAFWDDDDCGMAWVDEDPQDMTAVTLDGSFSLLGIASRILQDYEVVKK